MMVRGSSLWGLLFVFLGATVIVADGPDLRLGDKPGFGLFQPRITGSVLSDGQSLGPNSSSFLLDTGASGVLLYPPATTELATAGFENLGQFEEAGLSGTSLFDVSAPYGFQFHGTAGSEVISNIQMLSGATAPDATGLMGLNGIAGMPTMDGRVTSLDNRVRQGALPLSMGVEFSDALPATQTHRFTVPLTELAFPAEGDGPLPTFESLSTLNLISEHQGNLSSDAIVLDSGAQVTIINEAIATRLGLDANGNGDFADEAISTLPLSGATGTIQAPILLVDEMRIPTDQGYELTWSNAQVVVLDIHPRIQGVLGADFMTDDGGLEGSLGGLGGLGDLTGGVDLNGLGADNFDLEGFDLTDLFGGIDLSLFEDLFAEAGLGGIIDAEDTSDLTIGELAGIDDLLSDLTGGLGGELGGLLGGGDVFASFPLESYFDQVHFDFRDFPENGGQLVFDLNPQVSGQVLNGDHVFTVEDIDDLTANLGTAQLAFDVDNDGVVAIEDRELLIRDIFQTVPGDTDLDHDVDFADFLAVSAAFGQENAGWGDGDFDGNGSVEFRDFLALSSNFGITASSTVSSVPEPSTHCFAWGGLLLAMQFRRRIGNRPNAANGRQPH